MRYTYTITTLVFEEMPEMTELQIGPGHRVAAVLDSSRVRTAPEKWYVTVLVEVTHEPPTSRRKIRG